MYFYIYCYNFIFYIKYKKLILNDNAIDKKYDLYDNHAYSIKGYDPTSGMVYITNPWHTSVITEIPIYDLIKYIRDVNIAMKSRL